MVVFGELGGGQKSLVTMYTRTQEERDRFRTHRKLMHLGVGIQKVKQYRSFQNDESKLAAYDCLRDPEEYARHMERYATSVVSIIAFGRRVADATDPLITDVIDRMQLAAELNVPGTSFPMLMETFPSKFQRYSHVDIANMDKFLQSFPLRLTEPRVSAAHLLTVFDRLHLGRKDLEHEGEMAGGFSSVL